MKASVAISDLSVISPIGRSLDEFTQSLRSGKSGIQELAWLSPSYFPAGVAGRAYKIGESFEMVISQLLADLLQRNPKALDQVDLVLIGTNEDQPRLADMASGRPSRKVIDRLQDVLISKGLQLENAKILQVVNTCITGLSTVGMAFDRLRSGLAKKALVLGYESPVQLEDLLRYHSIGALAVRDEQGRCLSRPFSKGRNGFVKGEGAGAMILTTEHTKNSYCQIEAFAQTSDAWRLAEARDQGEGMLGCYKKIFASTQIRPEEINYINAHGTGTIKNDQTETIFIQEFFAEHSRKLPVSSLKSQIGHLNYACGIVEVIACALMIREQFVAPTINYEADPELNLDFVGNRSRSLEIQYLLKNSFGFGGNNAGLLLSR